MKGRLQRALGVAGGFGLVAWPRIAGACSVCLSATDGTREAYYGTTALLIAFPLLLVGSITAWLYRAYRMQTRLEREPGETDASLAVHSSSPADR